MAICNICNEQKGFFEMSSRQGICKKCFEKDDFHAYEEEKRRFSDVANHVRLSTSILISGKKIEEEFGLVSAECVFGMNVFKDIGAAFSDVVGGRSKITQNVFNDAKNTAIQEIKEQAYSLGGNAIIGLKLNFIEMTGGGKNGMLMVSAYGTAVKLV